MSLRTFSAVPLLLISACGGPPESVAPGNVLEVGSGTPAEAPVERVACAIGGADFAEVCMIDRAPAKDGTLVTIRHPDGGFRRLLVSADGKAVTTADGALPAAIVGRGEGRIEVAVGDARYRLPTPR